MSVIADRYPDGLAVLDRRAQCFRLQALPEAGEFAAEREKDERDAEDRHPGEQHLERLADRLPHSEQRARNENDRDDVVDDLRTLVVHASSINAIGCAWNITEFSPQYLPIDEDHPMVTTDPYSLSKQHVEDIGAYFWRRDGISSVALRFPGVYRVAQREDSLWRERRQEMRSFLDKFVLLPEAERHEQLARARQHCLAFRAERMLEYPQTRWRIPEVEGVNPYLLHAYLVDRFNLWASLDERDAAQSVEKSLTAPLEGNHNLFINDIHNSLGYDAETRARIFFPDVTARRQTMTGSDSLVSAKRARDLIGFEPQYSLIGDTHA